MELRQRLETLPSSLFALMFAKANSFFTLISGVQFWEFRFSVMSFGSRVYPPQQPATESCGSYDPAKTPKPGTLNPKSRMRPQASILHRLAYTNPRP